MDLRHCGNCRSRDVQTGLHDISCLACGAITDVDGWVRPHRQGITTTQDIA